MKNVSNKIFLGFTAALMLSGIFFQNCGTSSKSFNAKEVAKTGDEPPVENLSTCYFDGQEVADGDTGIAFQNSTVPNGSSCVYEQRTCNAGNLSGSYNYATCQVGAPAACNLGGRTISSGESITAYVNSSSAPGGSCVSETRSCTNGVLSGSYNFTACSVTPYAPCNLNGRNVPHNSSIKAYLSSTTAAGVACKEESRVCSNGTLSGSYNFSACTPGQFASCSFNGAVLAHGETKTAFQNSSVASGSTCQSQVRTCNDGVLSGSYNFGSCSVNAPLSCNFNGQNIPHGQSVNGYASSTVPFGSSCSAVTRTCNNGSLSNSGDFASCNVGAAASCNFNGQNYAHGQSVTMFTSSTVPFGGSCASQVRTCNNGAMSGSAAFASCSANAPASCLLGTTSIAHGQVVTAFAAASVPFGGSCAAEARTCNNGNLSGSYSAQNCSVTPAANCSFNGAAVAHNASVTAFAAATVPYGSSCSSQTRSCSNGTLSGSYTVASCKVEELIPKNVTVTAKCTISAANSQTLTITSADNSKKSWNLGNGNKTVAPFTVVFASAPVLFQAYSNSSLSQHRYSNKTANSINFSSEDGGDNDYNDLECKFTW